MCRLYTAVVDFEASIRREMDAVHVLDFPLSEPCPTLQFSSSLKSSKWRHEHVLVFLSPQLQRQIFGVQEVEFRSWLQSTACTNSSEESISLSPLCLFSFEILSILQVGFLRVFFWLWGFFFEWGVFCFFISRIAFKELVLKTGTMKQSRCKRKSQKWRIIWIWKCFIFTQVFHSNKAIVLHRNEVAG